MKKQIKALVMIVTLILTVTIISPVSVSANNEDAEIVSRILSEEANQCSILDKACKSTVAFLSGDGKIIFNSGVIISDNGYILSLDSYTPGQKSKIKLCDGRIIEATAVSVSKRLSELNLSILKVDENYKKFISTCLTFGNSDKLLVGNDVYSVSFNEDSDIFISKGIKSGICNYLINFDNPDGKLIKRMLYKNCDLVNVTTTKKSSGGALINSKGELIGVLLGLAGDVNGKHNNLNCALPTNQIIKEINSVISR